MKIPHEHIIEEIFKHAKGLSYTIKMFDEDGGGPISNPKLAKYIYLEDEGVMISMPDESSDNEHSEIFIYPGDIGALKDLKKFKNFLKTVKRIARLNGVGVTVRNYDAEAPLQKVVGQIKSDRELDEKEVQETRKALHMLQSYFLMSYQIPI